MLPVHSSKPNIMGHPLKGAVRIESEQQARAISAQASAAYLRWGYEPKIVTAPPEATRVAFVFSASGDG